MKSKLLLIFIVLSAACLLPQSAKSQAKGQQNIVEHLIETSDSTLIIDIPAGLIKEIVPPSRTSPSGDNANNIRKRPINSSTKGNIQGKTKARTSGYRIQIFSDGRNQNTLQARARARANKVLSRFPKYNHQVYSFSKSPNYYTRIGNFGTRAEANAALVQLRKAFPDFANEMRIVSCEVILTK